MSSSLFVESKRHGVHLFLFFTLIRLQEKYTPVALIFFQENLKHNIKLSLLWECNIHRKKTSSWFSKSGPSYILLQVRSDGPRGIVYNPSFWNRNVLKSGMYIFYPRNRIKPISAFSVIAVKWRNNMPIKIHSPSLSQKGILQYYHFQILLKMIGNVQP